MRSSESGQASAEYAGVLALVAVVLVLAATAVAAPDLPGAVVRQLRLGLCLVGGDVCRDADARARGLEPCVRSARGESRDVSVGVLVTDVGHGKEYTVERLSDGSVVVRAFDGGRLGRTFSPASGIGPVQLRAGPGLSLGVSFRRGREWHFATLAEAEDLLRRVRDPLRNLTDDGDVTYYGAPRAPVRYLEGGASVGVDLDLELGGERTGLTFDGYSAEHREALGRRVGPDGTTLYYHLDGETSGVLAELVPGLRAHGDWLAEWHLGTPQTLTIRSVEGEDGDGRREEEVVSLALTEPGDREAALKVVLLRPLPGLGGAAARDFMARVRERGSVERLAYEQRTTSRGTHVEGKVLGGSVGGGYTRASSERALVGAEVLLGGRKVQRVDCLGGV